MRILLVDEDRLFKDLLIRVFASDTCEVLEESAIASAKTAVVSRMPDLVIVNAGLPDALQFVLSLHAAKKPVLALVNADRLRDQLRLANIPVADLRGTLSALVDAIRSVLDADIVMDVGGSHHVLVVDDEEAVRSMLSDFLMQKGYTTSTARDGTEALRILDSHPNIAVVLLDVAMPRLGGIETLSRITQRKRHPCVIMISGIADELIARQAVKLGAFGYIVKPPDLTEVGATISACIARQEMAS
jgi:DNA-binding response OmpR family regulator